MAEENLSDVKEMIAEENCLEAKPMMAEESSMEMVPVTPGEESAVDNIPLGVLMVQKDIWEIHEVSEPGVVNLRRHSTGVIAMPAGKVQVQPRYRGNSSSSCHDICKHGKRQEKDVVKPWKLVRKKIVEGEDVGKAETLGVRRKSLGDGCRQISGSAPERPEKPPTAKRDALVVKKPSASVKPGSSSFKGVIDIVASADGLSVKRGGQMGDNRETENSSSDSVVVTGDGEVKTKSSSRKGVDFKNEKSGVVPSVSSSSKISVKKVPKISGAKSYKDENRVSPLKNLKNGQRTKPEPASSEDVLEKTLYVVQSCIEKKSLKAVRRGTQYGSLPSLPGKKITRSGQNETNTLKHTPSLSPSLEDKDSRTGRSEPRPMRQSAKSKTVSVKPGLHKRKETGSVNLTADPKTENKNRPKRIGIKITPPARQLSFRKGKVLELQPEDSAPRWLKFRRRVLPESPRGKTDGKRKNLKDKKDGNKKSNSTEGKPEKVVLRHRKVETKKKLQTLFNNVIEETASKLAEVRKSKVKALVGAFETVISLQDNKSSQKVQSRSTTVAANA